MKDGKNRNPLRPIATYIDLTLVGPVMTAAEVIRRKARSNQKATSRSSAKSDDPPALMDNRKYQTLKEARRRAREHSAIEELIERMRRERIESKVSFKPLPGVPAHLAAETKTGKPALYLVKRSSS